jgi:integrase
VLGLAHKRGWCDLPHFVIPKLTEGRTLYLFPKEAERLIAAAAPHLKPLLIFLLGTGARLSEAIYLSWDDRSVDLSGGRVIFWADRTKAKNAASPRCRRGSLRRWLICHTATGRLFRHNGGQPYAVRSSGGQIYFGFGSAVGLRQAQS